MGLRNLGAGISNRLTMPLALAVTLVASGTARGADNATDVVVNITGFISCNDTSTGTINLNKMGGLQLNAMTDLNKVGHAPVALVSGCFDQGHVDGYSGRQLYFMLRTRDTAGNETSQTLALHPIFQEPTGDVHEFDGLVSTVEQAIRSVAGPSQPRLHMFGHSYGAWMTMRLVPRFANNNGAKLATLTTIDAISPTLCNVRTFINSTVWTAEGCTHRPYDLSVADQQEIFQDMGGRWVNYYETQFHRLHSGPFEALQASGQNFLIHLENQGGIFNNYHAYIAADAGVWSRTQQFIVTNSAE